MAIELLTIPRFLDPAAILAEVRNAPASAATVYGGRSAVESNVRRTKRLDVSPATRDFVVQRLMEQKDAIASHFGVSVDECEEPQLWRYEQGDFFVAHQDGNTPLIRDDTRFRKISIVIFLSDRGDYDGGELQLHGKYPDFDLRERAPAEPGTLVAFPAETTHEVTPLTRGERFTIASWFRASE
jgi:SM-20-related protein